MLSIHPFKGFRYKSKNLSKLICPPYDVISQQEKIELEKISPYNFVRIELPDSAATAKAYFNDWVKKRIIIQDKDEAFYVISEKIKLPNRNASRVGLVCLLDLNSDILKHERATEAPIEDRLSLLKEHGIYTSPILCIVSDNGKFYGILKAISRKKPNFGFKKGLINYSVYILKEKNLISKIQRTVRNKVLLIADGHHRYEAAMRYRDLKGAKYIMGYILSSKDPGIMIMPTHRVTRLTKTLESKLNELFRFSEVSGFKKYPLCCFIKDKFYILTPKDKKRLPVRILDDCLRSECKYEEIFYTHDVQEAIMKAGEIDGIAFLLEPLTIEEVFKEAKSGDILPPKTTYFYPKAQAGIVFHKT